MAVDPGVVDLCGHGCCIEVVWTIVVVVSMRVDVVSKGVFVCEGVVDVSKGVDVSEGAVVDCIVVVDTVSARVVVVNGGVVVSRGVVGGDVDGCRDVVGLAGVWVGGDVVS